MTYTLLHRATLLTCAQNYTNRLWDDAVKLFRTYTGIDAACNAKAKAKAWETVNKHQAELPDEAAKVAFTDVVRTL